MVPATKVPCGIPLRKRCLAIYKSCISAVANVLVTSFATVLSQIVQFEQGISQVELARCTGA